MGLADRISSPAQNKKKTRGGGGAEDEAQSPYGFLSVGSYSTFISRVALSIIFAFSASAAADAYSCACSCACCYVCRFFAPRRRVRWSLRAQWRCWYAPSGRCCRQFEGGSSILGGRPMGGGGPMDASSGQSPCAPPSSAPAAPTARDGRRGRGSGSSPAIPQKKKKLSKPFQTYTHTHTQKKREKRWKFLDTGSSTHFFK